MLILVRVAISPYDNYIFTYKNKIYALYLVDYQTGFTVY